MVKAGTPTMGGIGIVLGELGGYLLSELIPSLSASGTSIITGSGLLVMGRSAPPGSSASSTTGSRSPGNATSGSTQSEDRRSTRRGDSVRPPRHQSHLCLRLRSRSTRHDFLGITRPHRWTIWAVILIYATSNAVNLTHGLDGLAAGSGIFSYAAYPDRVLDLSSGQRRRHLQRHIRVPHALDLAVVAVAMTAACAGIRWSDQAPAEIFMGDTVAGHRHRPGDPGPHHEHRLAAPDHRGIYVAEAASVILQVVFFSGT